MLAVLVVGVIFRLLLFAFAYQKLPLSSDEAWPGLMAMHMLEGEFPVVYWGQTYMGTQESFIDAALIFLFGAHTLTIRIYPLAFAFLFLAVSYWLARSSYNREVGLITLVLSGDTRPLPGNVRGGHPARQLFGRHHAGQYRAPADQPNHYG